LCYLIVLPEFSIEFSASIIYCKKPSLIQSKNIDWEYESFQTVTRKESSKTGNIRQSIFLSGTESRKRESCSSDGIDESNQQSRAYNSNAKQKAIEFL
jgi:hypothetical protein